MRALALLLLVACEAAPLEPLPDAGTDAQACEPAGRVCRSDDDCCPEVPQIGGRFTCVKEEPTEVTGRCKAERLGGLK